MPCLTWIAELRNIPVSSNIWAQTELSRNTVPKLHSLIFGGFRVVDCSIQHTHNHSPPQSSTSAKQQSCSSIDFVYGSDSGRIRGVHRFSVLRSSVEKEDHEAASSIKGYQEKPESITIEFESLACLPGLNGSRFRNAVYWFHLQYAMLLFREGVREVII